MPNKQIPRRSKTKKPKKLKSIWKIQLAVVVALVIAVGLRTQLGSKAFTGNHSSCASQTASSYNVATSSTFLGVVKMLNNGSSTWYPSFGVYLNDRPGRWSYQGNTLSRNIVPGDTATFNLTLHAPSTAGNYSYQSGMAIINAGGFESPCTAQTIAVIAPPTVSVTAPGNGTSVSNTTTIAASASSPNGAGSITNVSFFVGGTSMGNDTSSPYSVSWNTKDGRFPNGTYALKAVATNNINKTTASGLVNVTVNNQAASPAPSPSPSPTPSSGTRSSGTTRTATPPTPDTTPPSNPTDFAAQSNDTDKSINLTWTASTDNVGVTGYELDRSTDNQEWTTVAASITGTSYEDSSVGFNTAYHYRLQAMDNANNRSGYATVDGTSTGFQANVDPSNDSTINSDDEAFSVVFPSGTFDKPALCVIAASSANLPPQIDKYKVVAGPHDVTCRDSAGNVLSVSSDKSLALTVQLKKLNTSHVSTLSYYGFSSDNQWSPLQTTTPTGKDKIAHLNLGNNSAFVVMGKQSKLTIWKVILTVVVIIAVLVGVALLVSRFLLRRKYQDQYNDYMKKIRGG